MKKLLSMLAVGALLAFAGSASAAGPSFVSYEGHVPPSPDPVAAGAPVELFHCVKYKDLDEMAPCAVPMIVQVKDPCPTCCDPCSCCAPKCVNIKICVPACQCCPPEIKCRKDGERVRYDFGKYAVDIRVKKGYIEVDYQD